MIKVKAKHKLNLGHLEGMKEGEIALLYPDEIKELPDLPIVRFYIDHGSLEEIVEEVVEDKPKQENVVKDKPKKKKEAKND